MNAHANLGQSCDRAADIHRVPTQPVEFSHDENITGLEPIEQADEATAL
jgi:hypothetical protein